MESDHKLASEYLLTEGPISDVSESVVRARKILVLLEEALSLRPDQKSFDLALELGLHAKRIELWMALRLLRK